MRLRHKTWQEEMILAHPEIALEKKSIAEQTLPSFNMIEIGSGCGSFLIETAKMHPENRYLGVEIQRTAFAIGVKKLFSEKAQLSNIWFLNAPMEELMPMLSDEAIECIYLNFNDPWPKKKHHRRRLTYPTRLKEYYRILKKGGKIYVRTDNIIYFEGTKEYFSEFGKFQFTVDENALPGEIMSEFEIKHRALNEAIHTLIATKL